MLRQSVGNRQRRFVRCTDSFVSSDGCTWWRRKLQDLNSAHVKIFIIQIRNLKLFEVALNAKHRGWRG